MSYVVCIDPGHGGYDPGAIGPGGTKEKDVTLSIALKTRDILVGRGVRVVMTRTSDMSPSGDKNIANDLRSRCLIANQNKADCFVSIHANSGSSVASGAEAYYYASSKSSAGYNLAEAVLNGLLQATNLPKYGCRGVDPDDIPGLFELDLNNRGTKPAHFVVLQYTNMPATLIEVAFISNPQEEKLLISQTFQEQAARGIADGICKYLGIPAVKLWEQQKRVALEKLTKKARFNTPHTIDEPLDMGMLAVVLERLGVI